MEATPIYQRQVTLLIDLQSMVPGYQLDVMKVLDTIKELATETKYEVVRFEVAADAIVKVIPFRETITRIMTDLEELEHRVDNSD